MSLSASSVETGTTVVERVARHAETSPGSAALIRGDERLTYRELDRQAHQLATLLREAGAGPQACVALCVERSTRFVVAALAVMKIGAAYLPIDSATPPARAHAIIEDSAASLVLTGGHTSHHGWAEGAHVIDLDRIDLTVAGEPTPDDHRHPAPDEPAYVIYTSGSTGRPNGVEISHANLANLIDWHISAFEITPADRASQVSGLGFDAAVWEIWPHLAAGCTVHIADDRTRRSPRLLHDWLLSERITVGFVPTALAEQLLHLDWPPHTALRILLTGAEELSSRPPFGLPFDLINNYGPTECSVVASSGLVDPGPATAGRPSIGKPIRNTIAFVVDDQLDPVPPGQPGELCLAGPLVGRGYRNNPGLTEARFRTIVDPSGRAIRVYRTGDRVRILPGGELEFLGRLDEQVKIRGYRIELGEIATWCNQYPGVRASVVVAIKESGAAADNPADSMLVAYLVADEDTDVTGLPRFLATQLPEYMLPAHVIRVPALPLTTNGKVDRAALPAPPPSTGETTPRTSCDIPREIAELVATLLNRPAVGAGDNFFLLGGHSMLGVQLISHIRHRYGVGLSLRQLFSGPTVAALSAEVSRQLQASGAPA